MAESNRTKEAKKWLKDKQNVLLVLLIAFTILIRLYYFIQVGEQPIWWDEGDYLAIAKVWANGMATPEWWGHFTTMRPLLLPIIFAALFKIGLSELIVRFITLLVPGIISVYLVFIIGRDLYTSKHGLVAGAMMSIYWVFLFYNLRLLTDTLAVCFGLLSFYFFWSLYVKKGRAVGLYLCILFGVLGFSTRFPMALMPIVCALYLLITRKLAVFKDKTVWKSGALLILTLVPYLVFFISTKFYFLQFYFGDKAVSIKQPIAWYAIGMLPDLLHSAWFIMLLTGLFTLIPLFIGLDIVWKQKEKSLNADLIVALWIIVHLLFYVVILRAATDRWLLMLMPALFILSSKGLGMVYTFLQKYNKIVAVILVTGLFMWGFVQQASHAHSLIILKKDTYEEVKLAGMWIKENSLFEDKVISASIVQNQYYSERQTYDFRTNDTIWDSCTDLYGAINTNETCQSLTEAAFDKKFAALNPKYVVVSVFEPVFTPQWAYTYGDKHNFTAVQAYLDSNNQPVLVIYRTN